MFFLMPVQREDKMVKINSTIVNVHNWNREFMPHGFSNSPVIFLQTTESFCNELNLRKKFSTIKQMTEKTT